MSTCKKFGMIQPDDLSPEDRLTLLESKLPVLIERIQQYDRVVEENKRLKINIDELKKNLDQFPDLLTNIDSEIKLCKKQILEFHQSNKSNIDLIQTKHETLDKNYIILSNRVMLTHQIHEDNINDISDKLNSLKDTAATIDEVQATRNGLKSDINYMASQINNVKCIVNSHENFLKDFEIKNQYTNSQMDNLNNSLSKINTDFSVFPKQLKDIHDSISTEVNQTLLSFMARMNSSLDKAMEKLLPQGVSLQETKDAFNSKMDTFTLDLSNSILKSSNNFQQIKILEKKIENLYLLLKKYDLNK